MNIQSLHTKSLYLRRAQGLRARSKVFAASSDGGNAYRVGWIAALMCAAVAFFMIAGQAHARSAPESFADLAEKLSPAVVNISTTQMVESRSSQEFQMPQFPPGSPFEDFFKEFFDQNNPGDNPHGGKKRRRATSLGSGFVLEMNKNGEAYVVTNNHVIQDADAVTVILQDNTRLDAKIVGRDSKTDLAVLKIKSKAKLASVPFGDSDVVRVGDWIVAIGNPFGLGGTVTAGIISARGRDINAGPYDDFLQTDASINRGNSGGPMFNMDGEVIGVNTAIFSPSGGSVGIGFAIPSNVAKSVVAQLIEHGQVRRGWIGVHIQAITDELAETLGLKKAEGALVASVMDNAPAKKAGIKPGDVILTFDGKSVHEMRRLPRIVAETMVGKAVPVEVWRDGKLKKLTITVEEMDDDKVAASQPANTPRSDEMTVSELGVRLSSLTPELIEQFELGEDARGVVVTHVDSDGPAADKGIRAGDLIIEVGQQEVGAPADVEKRIKDAKKAGRKSVLLWIEGQGGMRFVTVKVGA